MLFAGGAPMWLRQIAVFAAALVAAAAGLCAFDYARAPVRAAPTAATDRIVVDKTARRMSLFKDGKEVRRYRVALGRGGPGAKREEGDGRVPEGVYTIAGRNPDSAYHLSLRIGYPTPAEARAAHRRGVDPGGDIMIHGIANGLGWIGGAHRLIDWTQGCIAVTDSEVEEIWRLVPDGTEIEIRG